jgi:multidrug efflux pump subunit AcrA (membrane-fusion protein)
MIGRAIVAIAAVALLAGAVTAFRGNGSIDVPTAVVEEGPFIDYLPARGEIRAERSVVLSAPSGADLQIIEIVANGASVKKGDAVAVFDSTPQQRTLEQKQSELAQAISELERARSEQQRRVRAASAELEQARSIAARQRLDLDAADLLSKVDAEKRAIAVANAERFVKEMEEKVAGEADAAVADVAIAEQKVAKTRYDLEDTQRIMSALTLRAPGDGMVSLLPNFRAGGPMSRTAPEFRRGDRAWSGAGIAELPDLSSVRMALRVDEADRARLAVNASARVRVDAVPDRELEGHIKEISLVATPDFTSFPPVRNFDVIVSLAESDPRLRSGMSATARLELDRIERALLVPSNAVFERDGVSVVYVLSGRSLVARPVTVARRGRDRVALAGGVEPGTRIALQPPDGEGDTP